MEDDKSIVYNVLTSVWSPHCSFLGRYSVVLIIDAASSGQPVNEFVADVASVTDFDMDGSIRILYDAAKAVLTIVQIYKELKASAKEADQPAKEAEQLALDEAIKQKLASSMRPQQLSDPRTDQAIQEVVKANPQTPGSRKPNRRRRTRK